MLDENGVFEAWVSVTSHSFIPDIYCNLLIDGKQISFLVEGCVSWAVNNKISPYKSRDKKKGANILGIPIG